MCTRGKKTCPVLQVFGQRRITLQAEKLHMFTPNARYAGSAVHAQPATGYTLVDVRGGMVVGFAVSEDTFYDHIVPKRSYTNIDQKKMSLRVNILHVSVAKWRLSYCMFELWFLQHRREAKSPFLIRILVQILRT
jgi:hypothetical protein